MIQNYHQQTSNTIHKPKEHDKAWQLKFLKGALYEKVNFTEGVGKKKHRHTQTRINVLLGSMF